MIRLILLALLMLAAATVHADAFQCGTSLVTTGDTRDQVAANIGEVNKGASETGAASGEVLDIAYALRWAELAPDDPEMEIETDDRP